LSVKSPSNYCMFYLALCLSAHVYIICVGTGEGAYARVFLATCLKTRRPVAVKVVNKYALNASQEACVRRELSNQARLWHPNVVPLQVSVISGT
jgi:serine/threonine protein kinase